MKTRAIFSECEYCGETITKLSPDEFWLDDNYEDSCGDNKHKPMSEEELTELKEDPLGLFRNCSVCDGKLDFGNNCIICGYYNG